MKRHFHPVTTMLLAGTVATAAIVFATSATASAHRADPGIAQIRAATKDFRSLTKAQAAGYSGLVTDINGKTCIDQPGVGAMGVHYANGALIDGTIDADHPEVVVYELNHDGRLKLGALEYLVFQDVWDATHATPPSLFGHEFMLTASPNRFGLPPYYSLHAWAWKHNPAGDFAMWNPSVHCPGSASDDPHAGHEAHDLHQHETA